MEKLLIEFIDTLDLSLKSTQAQLDVGSGMARLTINQFRYIDAIAALGEPTITGIAERLNITKASVTAGVNKLVRLGYVTKTQSSQDRRVFHVSLTGEGGRLIQAKSLALEKYSRFIEAALTPDEAAQFEATLAKLVQVFKKA
jgi:DNA-binding MarR family transcriptional regulator